MELVEAAEVLGVDMADLAIAVRDNMAVTKPATNTKDGHTNQTIPDKYGEEAAKPGNLPSNLSSNDGVEEAININVVKEESYGDDTNDEKLMTKEDFKSSDLKCRHCCRTFKTLDRYEKHQFNHYSEENPSMLRFPCEVCGKNFPKRTRLNIHRITHTNEKPFPCDVCERSFNQSSNLQAHKKKMHSGPTSTD